MVLAHEGKVRNLGKEPEFNGRLSQQVLASVLKTDGARKCMGIETAGLPPDYKEFIMFKKLMLALGTLGLVVSTPAAAEIRLKPRIEVIITNQPNYRDREYNDGYEHNNRYEQREYNRYDYRDIHWVKRPRCYSHEVTVRHPQRYDRFACMSREEFRRYRQQYRHWQ